MKANRTLREHRSDEGAVGIGTLIVFIATILVAAVASAVLIDTSNNLQEKAQNTGSQATGQVATNLDVVQTIGQILATGSSTKINALNITIGLAPGARDLDMNQLVIVLSNTTEQKRITYASAEAANKFTATEVRDPAASWTASSPILTPGALVSIDINLNSTIVNMELPVRTNVEVDLLPEIGSPVALKFRTPASYGVDKVFQLR